MAVSHDDYRNALWAFARRVPVLLKEHAATAPLAAEVERLELERQLQQTFTMAVIGPLKAGKSTLLNALIGHRLAPVGVTEATATENMLVYGPAGQESHFEIHWKDPTRPVERRPVGAVSDLIGKSEIAEQIHHLLFFADSPFLQGCRLIDSPGTQSNILAHEEVATDLLTRRYGERADAVVLVVPTIVGAKDRQQLLDFAEQSRLPGQGPYNTIAVLQMWETLEHPEPEVEARRLADDFHRRLGGQVSEVLPVSGLLGIMARQVPAEALDKLAFLATRSDPADLAILLKTETRLFSERAGAALSAAERRELYSAIRTAVLGDSADTAAGTYETVRFALGVARRNDIRDGESLRSALWRLSNLDRFQDLLHRRFFAISGLIGAGSVLTNAHGPCQTARYELSNALERSQQLAQEAGRLLQRVAEGPSSPLSDALRRHLAASQPMLDQSGAPIRAALAELERLIDGAQEDFRLLMLDVGHLKILAGNSPLSPELTVLARSLFGQNGMERHQRLGVDESAGRDVLLETANSLHTAFAALKWGSPGLRDLASHAVDRLDRILNELETGA